MKQKFALLILLAPLSLFAQKDFRPGYVVSLQGDTTKGFVQYKVSKNATIECHFKESENGSARDYVPTEIHGYGFIGGKVFVSKDLDGDSTKVSASFCEKLAEGRATLYRSDQSFYIEKDKLYNLESHTSTVIDENVSYEHKHKKFVGILYYLFSDCIKSTKEIYATALKEKDLVEITNKYNECTGSKAIVHKRNVAFVKNDFYVLPGIINSSFKFGNDQYPFLTKRNPQFQGTNPALGIGFQVTNPRAFENLYLTIETIYARQHMRDDYRKQTVLSTIDEKYDLKWSRVIIPLGLKYCFSSTSFTPYIRLGFSYHIFIRPKLTIDRVLTVQDPSSENKTTTNEPLKTFGMTQFWGALGVQKDFGRLKLHLEFRGEGLTGRVNSVKNEKDNLIVIDPKSIITHSLYANLGISIPLVSKE
jgi:hypothetical protein